MKIMERACGHEVKIGDRVWCHVDLASARDFGGANCVLQFEKEMGKDAMNEGNADAEPSQEPADKKPEGYDQKEEELNNF